MDQVMLEIIREVIQGRRDFFSRAHLFYENRERITQQILDEEKLILDIIRNMYLDRRMRMPITFTIPITMPANMMNPNFEDAVPVFPTAEQINHELIQLGPSSSPSVCSICQDSISSDGCQLRGCDHTYHTNCIRTWFSASVRCPVCRRDIREDPEDQTFSESQ
jgi:hypothetical protein